MMLRIGQDNDALDERPSRRVENRSSRFTFYLGSITIGHFVAVGLLILIPALWHGFFHKKSADTFPVEFVVDVSQFSAAPVSAGGHTSQNNSDVNIKIPSLNKIRHKIEEKQRKEREIEEKLEKERLDKEQKAQEKAEAEAAKTNKINVSTTQVTRPSNVPYNPTHNGPQLTPEQLREYLMQGAKAGDHTSIPEGDDRYFAMIKNQLYNAWNEPSHDEVGNAVAVVTVRFLSDGKIVGAALTTKTGIASMDNSVMEAVNSLSRIEGLSPDFLKYHNEVTVEFKVRQE
jgi:hypothetical protein